MVVLSVLDQSPVPSGSTPADALTETVALAVEAERLGYRRYWLAEHHGTPGLAGSAPEVMVARVAAATSSIRVGSGGVLLSHYSPLKVAEVFRVLHALSPGRIDLGIGRAAGASERTAAALGTGTEPEGPEQFARQVADLIGFLQGTLEEDHPFRSVHVAPESPGGPEVWLLGSSSDGAGCAAALGLSLCFAHFITPAYGPQIVAKYRRHFEASNPAGRPRASVAVSALCADTDAEARRLATSLDVWRLTSQVERGPLPSVEQAEARPLTDTDRARIAQNRGRILVGDPERVRRELTKIAEVFAVEELVVLTICHDPKARRRSYELLAEAFGLTPSER
ncbi:MAG TPA: LLM class flavin-dependent oxidoreductase [Acidimicrobiales bacterium]|nr:LLM class flavin-dependent oxidoreductase [Acidimicrobiales bacterium]